jgi:hypothetical protein
MTDEQFNEIRSYLRLITSLVGSALIILLSIAWTLHSAGAQP